MSLSFEQIKENYDEIKNEWYSFTERKKFYRQLLDDIKELCYILTQDNSSISSKEYTFSTICSKLRWLDKYERYVYDFLIEEGDYRCGILKNIVNIGEEKIMFITALFDKEYDTRPYKYENYFCNESGKYSRWKIEDKIYLCYYDNIFSIEFSEICQSILKMIRLWQFIFPPFIENAEQSNYFTEMYRHFVHIPMFQHIHYELSLKMRDRSLGIKINNK